MFLSRRAGRTVRILSVFAAALLAAPLMATGSGFTATYSIPIPPNSLASDEFYRWMQSNIVVPRDGKYRIRVQGSITATGHEPYRTACGGGREIDPVYLRTYGPMGIQQSNYMRVAVTGNPNSPIGLQGAGFLFEEVDSQTMETEVFLRSGTPLYVYIYLITAGVECPVDQISGPWIHMQSYDFAGSHTLTITEVVEQPATLVLECNGARGTVSLERGAALNCEAKTEPAGGAVTDARWTFQDAKGDGPTITGPAGQNAWSGPMVVGGTVTLAAKVNGEEQSATAAVMVTKRTWPDELPEYRTVYCPAAGVANCPLHKPPVYDKDVGSTVLSPGGFVLRGQAVQSGPNTGWHYIPGQQGPIRFTIFTTYLNVVLQDPHDPLFRGGCSTAGVTQWIKEHEAVHVRHFRSDIDQQRMNPKLEGVVAFSDADFKRELDRVNAYISRLLKDIGDSHHYDKSYPANPCDLPLQENP